MAGVAPLQRRRWIPEACDTCKVGFATRQSYLTHRRHPPLRCMRIRNKLRNEPEFKDTKRECLYCKEIFKVTFDCQHHMRYSYPAPDSLQTVLHLKQEICKQTRIPVERQRLMLNARWLLDSDHVRRDFDTDNIFLVEDNDDALTLRRRAPIVRFPLGDGTLSVRTPRGDTWHIPVQHGDTIGHIKMKIECAHGVDRARQRLFLGKDVLGDAGIAWPAVTLELVWSMRCSLSCTDRTPTIHSRFYFEVDGLRPEQTFDVTALLQVTGRDAACPEGRLIPGYTSDSTSPAQRAAGKRRIQWRNDSTFTLGMDVRVDVDRAWLDQLIDETVDRDGYAAIDYWPTTYFHIPGSSPVTIQLEVDGRQPIRIILQRNSLDMMREVRHMIAASCDVLLGSIHSILLQKACSRPLWASDIVFLNTDDTLLITLKSTTKKSSGDQALATTPTSPPGESIYERPPPHRLTPPRKRRIGQRVIDFGPASKRTNLHTETTPATPTHEAIKLTSQTVIDSPPKRVKQEAPDSQDDARADRCLHLSTPPAHGRLVHT